MSTTLILHPDADLAAIEARLVELGQWSTRLTADDGYHGAPAPGGAPRALALATHSAAVARQTLAALPGVQAVLGSPSAHPLLDARAGLAQRLGTTPSGRVVAVGAGAPALLLAGPCSAESEATARASAAMAAAVGARVLRGGAFKPRTSPYAYRGHGDVALGWLADAAREHDLLLVSEVTGEREAEAVATHADILQIGSRSMASFGLLRAVGELGRPVLLKRGAAATLAEFRLAAEHLLAAGASAVVLCERGVSGGDGETRNLLDLGAVALLAGVEGAAVVVDPSHAAGRRDLVVPLAAAAIAAGAHGILVEAHPDVAAARSDGPQALDADALAAVAELMAIAPPARTHAAAARSTARELAAQGAMR